MWYNPICLKKVRILLLYFFFHFFLFSFFFFKQHNCFCSLVSPSHSFSSCFAVTTYLQQSGKMSSCLQNQSQSSAWDQLARISVKEVRMQQMICAELIVPTTSLSPKLAEEMYPSICNNNNNNKNDFLIIFEG